MLTIRDDEIIIKKSRLDELVLAEAKKNYLEKQCSYLMGEIAKLKKHADRGNVKITDIKSA